MSADRVSVDTNILLYPYDGDEPAKAATAVDLIGRLFVAGRPRLSVQALNEFYWNATRKLRPPLTADEARDAVERYAAVAEVVPLSFSATRRAITHRIVHSLPFWDGLMIAVAAGSGANYLLSEDLQHRRVIDGVTILNPFAPDFDLNAILAAP